jgi:hypothetical protein
MLAEANDQAAVAPMDLSRHDLTGSARLSNGMRSTPSTAWRAGLGATLAFAVLIATGSAAMADRLNFQADLTGGREVPPNDSTATGHIEATLDTSTNTLTWTGAYSGLSGAPIGAHFHGPVSYIGATSEENAPIQVGTPGNLASPFKGTATIDATQAQDLRTGRWYFNLHSPKFPGGEIRGPVVRK